MRQEDDGRKKKTLLIFSDLCRTFIYSLLITTFITVYLTVYVFIKDETFQHIQLYSLIIIFKTTRAAVDKFITGQFIQKQR